MEGATDHLVTRTREDKEARMVGLTQQELAECVEAPTGARTDGLHRTGGRPREDRHTHHHVSRTNSRLHNRTDVKMATRQVGLKPTSNPQNNYRVAQSGVGTWRKSCKNNTRSKGRTSTVQERTQTQNGTRKCKYAGTGTKR